MVVVVTVAKTVVREEKPPCGILGGASQIELILQRTCKHIKQGLETILNLSSNTLVIFL